VLFCGPFFLLPFRTTEAGDSAVSPAPHVFAARIYKVWLIRFVDVPKEISRALGSAKERIPVCGTVGGLPLRTTLVPSGNGRHRLAIHGDIYRKLRIDAGAVVEISLELDEESREPVLPPSLIAALKFSKVAAREFRAMTTALRRQIVRYLTSAKSEATVERRVAKFVTRLEKNPPSARSKAHKSARNKRAKGKLLKTKFRRN
jgi:hypothetical protein